MKNPTKKIYLLTAAIVFAITSALFAQEKKSTEEIKIKTSALCEMCKARIEKALAYQKGVKKAVLDLETKEVAVVYKPEKTNPEKLRKAIAKTGYDADSVHAEKSAYDNLPNCCKKGGH